MRPHSTSLWDHQQRFRDGLQSSATQIFDAAGESLSPRALLVGTSADGAVVEPSRAVDTPLTVPQPDDLEPEHLRRVVQGELERVLADESPVVVIGAGGVVEGRWHVLPVLCFPRSAWDSRPTLPRSVGHRHLAASFPEALAAQLLDAASLALRAQQAPSDFGTHVDPALVDETIRRAATRLTDGIVARVGHEGRSGLHQAMDAVAAQPYEGKAGLGRVVLARDGHPDVDMRIRFVDPIPVSSTRRFRKALEVTNDALSLVCDGTHVRGLGVLRRSLDGGPGREVGSSPRGASVFELDVLGRGEWQVGHAATPLLRVSNTRPVSPALPLSAAGFHAAARSLFPTVTHHEARVLWDLTETASRTEGGTILVFHPDAAGEARRLSAQAQLVEAEVLGPRAVEAITTIDGAVLLDPSGRCHAIGVILDGVASDAGDPGRGARYNSAVRYHQGPGADALVVVVSEDGMIDLVPSLDELSPGPS